MAKVRLPSAWRSDAKEQERARKMREAGMRQCDIALRFNRSVDWVVQHAPSTSSAAVMAAMSA